MKKIKRIKSISIVVVITLLLTNYSCRKEIRKENVSTVDYSTVASVTFPNVNNGILEFTDYNHLQSWMGYLEDELIRDTSIDADTIGLDSTLHAIEINLGFNSLRQKTYEEFETLNETGWNTVDEIPDRHWSNDITLQSILNEYEEVKVGNDVVSFIDEETIIKIADELMLSTVRNFKLNGYISITDIYQEPGVLQSGVDINGVPQLGNITVEKGNKDYSSAGVRDVLKTSTDPYSYIHGTISYGGCPAKAHLNGYYIWDQNTSSKVTANYSVDWGDGSPIQNIGSTSELNAVHTYTIASTHTIKIFATHNSTQSTFLIKNQSVQAGGCATNFKEPRTWYYPVSGWALRGRLKSPSGYLNRIKAFSESFRWKNNKWRKKKSDNLYVKCQVEYYDPTNAVGCSNSHIDSRQTSSHKSRKVRVAWSVDPSGGAIGWKSLHGTHSIFINGQWYQYYQYVTPCD